MTVCEFWCAVNTGALAARLKSDAIVHLLRAQGAFGRLGAVRIASTLRAAIAQFAMNQPDLAPPSQMPHRQAL